MHDEYTGLMSVVLDDEATPEQATALRHHVADCGSCAAVWREWRALDVRLAATPALEPPVSLMAGLTARLAAHRAEHHRRRWLASGLVLAWAGMLCVVWLASVVALAWGYSHPVEVGLLLSSGAQIVSSLAWLLRGAQALVGGWGEASWPMVAGCFVSLTACLALLWVWLMMRSDVRSSGVRSGGWNEGTRVTEP